MKKFLILIIALGALSFPATSFAISPVSVSGCPGTYATVVSVGSALVYNKTVNNTAVVGAGADVLTIKGNNDCVLSGVGSSVKVTGNHDFIQGTQASLKAVGNNDTLVSGGGSAVNGGGNVCDVNPKSDSEVNCL